MELFGAAMVAVREVWVYSGTHSHYSGSTSDPMSIAVIRNDGNGEIVAIWCRSRKMCGDARAMFWSLFPLVRRAVSGWGCLRGGASPSSNR